MAELLADIPAADPVRRRLLGETLRYYQEFAVSANNDPELKEDLAITFGKIGALHSELHEDSGAIDALVRSESLYAELSKTTPGDNRVRLDWSTSQNNLAQALAASGKLEDAARYFAKAIVTQRGLLRSEASAQEKFSLATTLNKLGLLLADSLAIEEAEEAYRELVRQPDWSD